MAKGYLEDQNSATYNHAENPSEQTGINVQLLNSINETELDSLFRQEFIGMQEKFDGKRMVLVLNEKAVYGVNRLGLRCGIPTVFETALKNIAAVYQQVFHTPVEQLIIDGEAVGERFYAFDLLELNHQDCRPQTYLKRWETLKTLIEPKNVKQLLSTVVCSDLITGEVAKRNFFNSVKNANLEGVVLKNINSSYRSGRPNSGGNQLKYKFCAEATCQVESQNDDKRSVKLQVLDGSGNLRPVGNCTIPVNHRIPPTGAFVEIRYLYFFKGSSLFQPVYKGIREDKTKADTLDSLKVKRTGD